MKIITYPKKKFDLMVSNKEYSPSDIFISIGYTRRITHFEPGYDTPIIPDSQNFLRVKFDDVIEDFGKDNIAFTKDNAEAILNICNNAEQTSTIHIHCQAGQSRSAAVGEALKEIYDYLGIDSDLIHTSGYVVPNKTVLKILLENKEKLKLNVQEKRKEGS